MTKFPCSGSRRTSTIPPADSPASAPMPFTLLKAALAGPKAANFPASRFRNRVDKDRMAR